MRNIKRFAVVAVISILALGVAPAQSTLSAGKTLSPNAIACCK